MTSVDFLRGIVPAVVTPMRPDYSVDYEAIPQVVNAVAKPGVSAICCTAHVGEVRKLSRDERIRVAEAYVRASGTRLAVIAGLESEFIGEAVGMLKDLEAVGVSAVMVLPPWHMAGTVLGLFGAAGYVDPSGEHTYRYHAELAESTDLPLLLFNYGTGSTAGYSEVALEKLCRIERVKGMKIASTSPLYLQETIKVVRAYRPDLSVLIADDLTLFFNLLHEPDGALIGIASVATDMWVTMWELVTAKRYEEALALHRRLTPLMLATHIPLPVHVVRIKIALKELGVLPSAAARPPYYQTDADTQVVRQALRDSGLYQSAAA